MKFVCVKLEIPGLVVAAEEIDVLGVEQLQAKKKHDCFEGIVAPVHEVADEDVAVGGGFSRWVGAAVPMERSLRTS